MDQDAIVKYWIDASEGDFELSQNLFENKRFSYCLFFVHLSIEKLLKGIIVNKTSNSAPYEHNLVRLAEATGIKYSEEQLDMLADITTFNIKARYDDYKNQFYKIATEEYTKKYLLQAEEFILWLKRYLEKI